MSDDDSLPLHVRDGTPLPPHDLRTGPAQFRIDDSFLKAAREHLRQLSRHASLAGGRVLDFGCGVGRLYYGFTAAQEPDLYVGCDIRQQAIAWAEANIAAHNRRFSYVWADVNNGRYNAGGRLGVADWRTRLKGPFDVIYANSVLSHMTVEDARDTLALFAAVLDGGGRIFVTAFVDEAQAQFAVNPPGFGQYADTPLHVAVHNRGAFEAMLRPAFEIVDRIDQGRYRQTIYILGKA